MPTTWEDVDRELDYAVELMEAPTDSSRAAIYHLIDAVSALAELLAPPADIDERIAEAVAADPWYVQEYGRTEGEWLLRVWGSGPWILSVHCGADVVHQKYGFATPADAFDAADAWLAEQVKS